jgi:hypothetical protein
LATCFSTNIFSPPKSGFSPIGGRTALQGREKAILKFGALAPWAYNFLASLKDSYFFAAIGDYPKRPQLKHKANSQKQRADFAPYLYVHSELTSRDMFFQLYFWPTLNHIWPT